VPILEEGGSREKGDQARLTSFVGAIAIGDLLKSTLGPKGMDKILQPTSTATPKITNDGATILSSLHLDNPAAKVLVSLSKTQDEAVGDGTTSVSVLAAELLREAEKLIEQHRIHPQTVVAGYRLAADAAKNALTRAAIDHSSDENLFRQDLINIAKTTLSSKVLAQNKQHFAELAVNAILRLRKSPTVNIEMIHLIKKPGGRLQDSYLDDGFILDKKIGIGQPKRITNAKILVANTLMDSDKIKVFGARVKADSTARVAELERAERDKMKAKVEAIKACKIDCFINRQLIYDWPEQLFSDAGIMAIEHADFEGVERLAFATGAQITSSFDDPERTILGHAELIEEVQIGDEEMIRFSGLPVGAACTVILRGATSQILDEAERSLHDAFCVLQQTLNDPRTVFGAGHSEMLMAAAVDRVISEDIDLGKKAYAVEAFARALRALPTAIADNGGFDSADLISRLKSAHSAAFVTGHACWMGLDMQTGSVGDVRDLAVVESYRMKQRILMSASEAAEMLVRVDSIIKCAPRKRQDDRCH
jgi:T-complex protein 1 subunit beta